METGTKQAAAPARTDGTAVSTYRWVVLAVGTTAQATAAAVGFSVAVLAPEIRSQFDLSLSQMGIALAAVTFGMTPAFLPWGLLTDRAGERLVLPLGLGLAALPVFRIGSATGFTELVVLLAITGALIGSTIAASGRAVMQWFAPSERGLALGIRQSSAPVGGLLAAVALPPLGAEKGLGWAYAVLAAVCVGAAALGAIFLRVQVSRPPLAAPHKPHSHPLRRPSLWVLSAASGLLLFAQISTMSFTVLFLTEERGVSLHAAALALALQQLLGGALRIVIGHWSDRRGRRIRPLRQLTLVIAAAVALVGVAAEAPLLLLVPVIVVAGGIALSWNGLSVVSVAEIAGTQASGTAIGLQQTMLGISATLAPIAFAAVVSQSSWAAAYVTSGLYPVASWLLLRRLSRGRAAR